jgi:RNA binding exosome subunit
MNNLKNLLNGIEDAKTLLNSLLNKLAINYSSITISYRPYSQEGISPFVLKFIKEHGIEKTVDYETGQYGENITLCTLYFETEEMEKLFEAKIRQKVISLNVKFFIDKDKKILDKVHEFITKQDLHTTYTYSEGEYTGEEYFESNDADKFIISFDSEESIYEFYELFPNGIVENK